MKLRTNNSFNNVLVSDFYKLSKHKSIIIALIVMFFLVLINWAAFWVSDKLIDPAENPDAYLLIGTSKDYLFNTISNGNLGLFLAIIAGIFIGKEFTQGTVRNLIGRGIDRKHFYLSKLLSLTTLLFAYMCILLIVGGIFTAFKGYGEPFTGAQFGILMRSFALQFLTLISSVSIFVMLAFLCRSSGSTIGACIGFYLVISILSSVLSVVGAIDQANTQTLEAVCYFLPYGQSTIAASSKDLTTIQIVAVIVMPIVYTALSTIIGLVTFEKRDIK